MGTRWGGTETGVYKNPDTRKVCIHVSVMVCGPRYCSRPLYRYMLCLSPNWYPSEVRSSPLSLICSLQYPRTRRTTSTRHIRSNMNYQDFVRSFLQGSHTLPSSSRPSRGDSSTVNSTRDFLLTHKYSTFPRTRQLFLWKVESV